MDHKLGPAARAHTIYFIIVLIIARIPARSGFEVWIRSDSYRGLRWRNWQHRRLYVMCLLNLSGPLLLQKIQSFDTRANNHLKTYFLSPSGRTCPQRKANLKQKKKDQCLVIASNHLNNPSVPQYHGILQRLKELPALHPIAWQTWQ